MTSARRTPRYVDLIGPEPMGPHLVNAEPEPHGAAGAHARPLGAMVSGSVRATPGVIPLHPEKPVLLIGDRPARVHVIPVDRRPWHVLIVSDSPRATPLSFDLARWQFRSAVAALALVTVLACGFIAALVIAIRSPDLFVESVDVRALRSELAATADSLATMRASLQALATTELGSPAHTAPGSGEPVASAIAAPAKAGGTLVKTSPAHRTGPAERPKPLHTRTGRISVRESTESSALDASTPRSFAELPVIGALVSGFSRARRHPLLHVTRPHLGVDLAAPRGTRVSAPAAGRVQFVGSRLGFGLVVELNHGQGITTRYAHLRSAAVEPGEQVTKGEAIAAVGTSGITTGPHLHYEVLVHGHQVDPLRFRFPLSEPPVPTAAVAGMPPTSTGPMPSGGGSNGGAHDAAAPTSSGPSPRQ